MLAPVAEPELAVVLRREIAAAMAARGMTGDGPGLQVEVLSSSSETTAASSEQRGERSHLRIEARVLGPDPTRVVLEADLGYLHSTDLGSGAAVRRADAQERLANELASQLVEWLAARPQGGGQP